MADIESRQDQSDKTIKLLAEHVSSLQEAIEVANKLPVDLAIIKAHAGGLVTLDTAAEALTKWTTECGIDGFHFHVHGQDTSRFSTIQFAGLPGPASRRVQKALNRLRNRDGSWALTRAPAIAGSGSVELRVGPDKSPRLIKPEIVGKRVRQARERAFPNHTWRVDRAKGWVSAALDATRAIILGVQEATAVTLVAGVPQSSLQAFRLRAKPPIPGRALRTAFQADDQKLIFYNIHNYGINNAATRRISMRTLNDQRLAKADPSRVLLFVLGDFSFAAVGKLKPTEPSSRTSSEAAETSKASARKWRGALEHLVEIEGNDTTHYCAETMTEFTIDRRFCSITPSQMMQLAVASTAFSTPEELSRRRASDHAAALVSFAMRDPKAEKNQPIAPCSIKSPIFKQIAEKVFNHADLDKLVARSLPAFFESTPKLRTSWTCSDQVKLADPAKFEALQRKIRLWSPISKRLALTGVKTSVGAVTGPTDGPQKLVEHWQPVSRGKNVDIEKAADYLDHFAPKIGEDPDATEHVGCHRDPCKVRVLGLRNTSRKISSSALTAAMATVAADVVPVSRRGFIHHPNFGHNILELDVESRIASADPDAFDALPAPASPGIARAFPSLAHDILAMAPCAGRCIPLFYIRSGIVQGRGWSGALYAMGTACFLLDLEEKLKLGGLGICRA
ncbi:unnamed protein product [Prorocentrum cordatum]|uniref:Uncharacterized protein n=1 Tax=Prorocentrum cordatum TaxID=2364126 RepID=A0ABN9SY61_9DINO|nr:unnamed protein product [Polarella glacialis]